MNPNNQNLNNPYQKYWNQFQQYTHLNGYQQQQQAQLFNPQYSDGQTQIQNLHNYNQIIGKNQRQLPQSGQHSFQYSYNSTLHQENGNQNDQSYKSYTQLDDYCDLGSIDQNNQIDKDDRIEEEINQKQYYIKKDSQLLQNDRQNATLPYGQQNNDEDQFNKKENNDCNFKGLEDEQKWQEIVEQTKNYGIPQENSNQFFTDEAIRECQNRFAQFSNQEQDNIPLQRTQEHQYEDLFLYNQNLSDELQEKTDTPQSQFNTDQNAETENYINMKQNQMSDQNNYFKNISVNKIEQQKQQQKQKPIKPKQRQNLQKKQNIDQKKTKMQQSNQGNENKMLNNKQNYDTKQYHYDLNSAHYKIQCLIDSFKENYKQDDLSKLNQFILKDLPNDLKIKQLEFKQIYEDFRKITKDFYDKYGQKDDSLNQNCNMCRCGKNCQASKGNISKHIANDHGSFQWIWQVKESIRTGRPKIKQKQNNE